MHKVNGRNAISWEKKFEWDVQYVDNASFMLDIIVLFKTALKLLRPVGINHGEKVTMPKFMGTQQAVAMQTGSVTKQIDSDTALLSKVIPLTQAEFSDIDTDDIEDTEPSLETLLIEFKSRRDKVRSRLIKEDNPEALPAAAYKTQDV